MSLPTPHEPIPRAQVSAASELADRLAAPETFARETQIVRRGDRLDAAVASSRGPRHALNEDCHSAIAGDTRLFIVADGVGGGALAARASSELVARLHATLEGVAPDAARIRSALLAADRAIARSIASRTDASGAATVALCTGSDAAPARWLVAWVGDCRVYRLRAAASRPAEPLTVDDTYRHLHESPPPGGSPDDPARMVGNGAVDAPNVRAVRLDAGEMLVLCSDGVHKHADRSDISRILHDGGPLGRRCVRLVELARSRGSHDDATVLVVQRADADRRALARWVVAVVLGALVTGTLLWLAGGAAPGHGLVAHVAASIVPSSGAQP